MGTTLTFMITANTSGFTAATAKTRQTIKELQNDLNLVGKIDFYRGLEESANKTEQKLARLTELARKMGERAQTTGSDHDLQRYKRATSEVEKLSRALKTQRSALEHTAGVLRSNGIEVSNLAQHYNRLQTAIIRQRQANAARSTLGIRSDSDIKGEIVEMQKAYAALAASGRASAGELNRAYAAMQSRITDLRRQTGGWTTQMGQMHAVIAGIAAAMGGLTLARGGLSQFVGFDDTMLRVQALTNATAEQLAGLREQAKQLGAETRFSAADAASGMAEMAAAGMSLSQISGSIGAALDMAAVAGMDLGNAANQLTDIMTQFGIEGDRAGHVADVLTAGFTGAATSMQQLNEALSYAGPFAASFGYTLEETVAALQVLANSGLKASRGGTALAGIFAALKNETSNASKLLKSYNIEVKNTDGTLRNFADILEDIEKAGIDSGKIIAAFGLRAGPGMTNLLNQGSAALRKYQDDMKNVDDMARQKAKLMESGLGGAWRALQAAATGVGISMGEAVAPALIAVANGLGALAKNFSELPPWMQAANAGLLAFATAGLGIAPIIPLFGGLIRSLQATNAAMVAAGATAGGLRGVLNKLFVAAGAWEVGYAIGSWLEQLEPVQVAVQKLFTLWQAGLAGIRLGWAKAFGSAADVTAIERELQMLRDMYDNTERDIQAARKKTTEESKKARSETAKHAAQVNDQEVADAEITAKELSNIYKSWLQEVRRLQDDIWGRQKSLAAELRDMARGGMNSADAWVDQRNAAKEYVKLAKQAAAEARAAFASGDTITAAQKWKEAVAYADDAKSAYKALNHEVKDGDRVIISAQTALKGAMNGVKEAGQLAIGFLQEQEQAAAQTAREMEKTTDFATLTSQMDAAEKKWAENMRKMSDTATEAASQIYNVWQNAAGFWTNVDDEFSAGWSKTTDTMSKGWQTAMKQMEVEAAAAAREIERLLDKATKDRVVHITVQAKQQATGYRWGGLVTGYRWGGLVAASQFLASGGRVRGGYGGGDKVPAMLEPGEFVLRKEVVKVLTPAFLERLNANVHAHIRPMKQLLAMPQLAAATVGGSRKAIDVNLNMPSGNVYQMQADPREMERMRREEERWWNLRSSNNIARWNRRVSNNRFKINLGGT